PRHAHASAIAIETQPVIMALQGVADDLAHGERQPAMRAAILERAGHAVGGAEQHDRLAQDYPTQRPFLHLAVEGGDVPVIAEKHGHLLRRQSASLYAPAVAA